MMKHQRYLFALTLIFHCLLITPVMAQQLKADVPFHLVEHGYGAAALGIGGAFVGVADDVSTIYWNPAGLTQLPEVQSYLDFRFQGDSDEDFAAEVEPNRFQSPQRFEVSGRQIQAAAVSYTVSGKKFSWTPAFAWQRLSVNGPDLGLKEAAGFVDFLDPRRLIFVQSEGTFNQEWKGAEDEFTFGVGFAVSQKIRVGGTWSFLRGRPQRIITGTFHDTFIQGFEGITVRTDTTLEEGIEEDISGNYAKLGFLFIPLPPVTIGASVRLPYTRKSEITIARTGTIVTDNQASRAFEEGATADATTDIPATWSVGGSVWVRRTSRVAGSVTYGNWADVEKVITNSSDLILLPETSIPFPTDRATDVAQETLLQLRGGIEYYLSQPGNGVVIRTGIFRDRQPYGDATGDRVNFKGYTFGAGFLSRAFRIDAAYISESGEVVFTSNSRGPSRYSNRRWILSVGFVS